MAASRFEHPSAAPLTLLLPDLDCGGPAYWQRRWADTRFDCRTVDLGRTHCPDRNTMVTRLDQALRGADAPVVLVGHGVGALTVAAWAGLMSCESEVAVVGALLIAPGDPAAAGADPRLRTFAPLPSTVFSFPALVVASENDPAIAPDRAFSLARQWGAGFARFGACGHFTAADGLGWWPEGEELLDRFIDLVEPGGVPPIRGLDQSGFGLPAPSGRPSSNLFRP